METADFVGLPTAATLMKLPLLAAFPANRGASMILNDLETFQSEPDSHLRSGRINPSFSRRALRLDRSQFAAQGAIEETLSSALLASDLELDQILHEVDEISKKLKAGAPDLKTLKIAQHPAVWGAVKQTLLERELRHLALTDDLTCLYNRRGFFAVAAQLLKLAHRKVQPLLLFFCDLDNLKLINDSFGHQEGDLAIIRVADALERSFRDADVIARIGGDEFVIMSLEASGRIEASLLRRLERNLRKAADDESRYQLSLSVGVARFDPKRPISLGQLMSRADQAMYEQKRGRSLVREIRPPAAAPSNGDSEASLHAVAQPAALDPVKPCS